MYNQIKFQANSWIGRIDKIKSQKLIFVIFVTGYGIINPLNTSAGQTAQLSKPTF